MTNLNIGTHWASSWTTAPAPAEGVALHNQTLRMIAHMSIGGRTLRVRLSNGYGTRDLLVGNSHLGLRSQGAGIVPGSDRPLTFGGGASAKIAPGAFVVSDPIELEVPALTDVVVSFYLPQDVGADFQVTGHLNGHQTGYISPPGDFSAAAAMPVTRETEDFLFLSAVEVLAPAGAAGIVALGDSLTDCNISTLDANNRWPDQLARRLAARPSERMPGVMNQGFGGNRILHDSRDESAVRRFDRDVLAQPGVTHVIVLVGINDIRNHTGNPDEVVTAAEMIAGVHQLAVRAHTASLKILCGTLLTFEFETFNPGFYSPEGEAKRVAVNQWIHGCGAFDGAIDFEAALRDPGHPTRMLPKYDCGDHLHPSDAGYLRMGDIIDFSLFD